MSNLDVVSHVIAIVMFIAAIAGWVIVWRKNLLRKGFEEFRSEYKNEMKEFKHSVMSMVNTFREIMNKNEERHTATLDRIVEIHSQTREMVNSQLNKCHFIQQTNMKDEKEAIQWRKHIDRDVKKMDTEIQLIQKDVAHIKKVLNHES